MTFGKRNLLGGFLGGVLGIFALAWTGSWLVLICGIMIGAALGFWHREMWEKIATAKMPEFHRPHLRDKLKNSKDVRTAANALLTCVTMISIVATAVWLVIKYGPNNPNLFAIVPVMILYMGIALAMSTSLEKASWQETEIEDLYTKSIMGLLMRDFAKKLARNIYNIIWVITSVILYPLGFAFMLVPFSIIWAISLPFKAFAWALKRDGHWSCFGITLFVTITTALYTRHLWSNPVMIAVSALVAGSASGALSYLAYPYTSQLQWPTKYVNSLSKELKDVATGFSENGENLWIWFKSHQPRFFGEVPV